MKTKIDKTTLAVDIAADTPGTNHKPFTIFLGDSWYKSQPEIVREEIETYMKENNMKYYTLEDIINKEEYKVRDGNVVWRSGMDGGAFDPNVGRHISAYVEDWLNSAGVSVSIKTQNDENTN